MIKVYIKLKIIVKDASQHGTFSWTSLTI